MVIYMILIEYYKIFKEYMECGSISELMKVIKFNER